MRKIIFSLLLILLLLPSSALAFSDDIERYSTDISEQWYKVYVDETGYNTGEWGIYCASSVSEAVDPSGLTPNTVMRNYLAVWEKSYYDHYVHSWITTYDNYSLNYMSFIVKDWTATYQQAAGLGIKVTKNTGDTLCTFDDIQLSSITDGSKFEVIQSGSYFNLYKNGVLLQSKVNSAPAYTGDGKLWIATFGHTVYGGNDVSIYIDDFSTSSIIGCNELYNEGHSTFSFSWAAQLMRSYPDSDYKIKLYSITNPDNAGLIATYNIPTDDNSTMPESGYITQNRNTVLGTNFGLYLLEMTRDNDILTSTYFYYDSLSNPVGFPETLFMGSSDVSMDIRDHANNGGLISQGGSVYLYATNGTAGYYPISYELKNTPYSFTATLTKVYSTETNISSNITFSGLTNFYNVELDGSDIGTADSDTFSYNIEDWDNYTEHIFEFSPDLTQPGVYGYIKDLNSKTGVHSAIVTVSNNSWSTNIATDETGFYYLPGLPENETYSISAAKSGYTASSTFSVSILSGETTRKDIYLDPVSSGAGYYYAPHDVTFTVLKYWYSSAGLPGVAYVVYDNENESVKNGTTGSKGTFTVKDMDAGINYTFILTYNGTTYTEYIEPGLTEYTLVLNKEGIVHQYYNSWLNLTYAETSNNATILYTSNKTVSAASLSVTASNGTIVQSGTLNSTSGTFLFNFTEGDYILQFNIEASDGSTAAQAWSISSPPEVTLFPASYPTWLKNTLFVTIIIIFLLAFGKSKNDIACGSVAVLTSLGYYFEWLSCGFNFVVLIWIIALGAIFLHYKRTGAVG